ncbi:hypothetical protein VP01_4291g1 [Puccinia sorghi]|uniref:Uncharacterized protein n=1 Tax=Puccinia sorghi TaxID=27349 RepID=A0A0L6UQ69_9BASI|nr:hypothetical protein VP01_4291g1 [Puccinia sorghi]
MLDQVQKMFENNSDGYCGSQAVSYFLKLGKGQYRFMDIFQQLLNKFKPLENCICACPPWHSFRIFDLQTINPSPIFHAYRNSQFSVLELQEPLIFPSPICLKSRIKLASPEALKWEEKSATLQKEFCSTSCS